MKINDFEKRLFGDLIMNVSATAAATTTTESNFNLDEFNKLISEVNRINNMPPKEYTRHKFDGKFDTIMVKSIELELMLKREFGDQLNVKVNPIIGENCILYDSEQMPVRMVRD